MDVFIKKKKKFKAGRPVAVLLTVNTHEMGNHIDSLQVEFLLNKAQQSVNVRIHSYFGIVSPCVKLRTMVSSLPLLATIALFD